MEEVYTCKCGGQSWKIYSNRIKCTICGKEYSLISAHLFNQNILDEKRRETVKKKIDQYYEKDEKE